MSHTIWGSFDGALTKYIRPYIEVSWTQNIANNTSTVTARLYFHRYTNNYWSYNELTNSNGHSCSFRVGNSTLTQIRPFNLQRQNPPNRVLIWSRTQTINHNADGTATVNISANGRTNVNPNTYAFGESITLPQIPRQTDIESVSIENNLIPNVENTLNVTLDRKLSTYTHRFEILDGSTILQSSAGGLVTTIGINASTVNKMIESMSTVTSKNFTFRVVTLNGSIEIGSHSTNFKVALNTNNTRPIIKNDSVSIHGTGHDKAIGKYVQNISKIHITFDAEYGLGASYQSMKVNVAGHSVRGTRDEETGVFSATSETLTASGTVPVVLSATNTRGQTTTKTINVTVHAYNPPRIQQFYGNRDENNDENVEVVRRVSFSSLDGDNALSASIQRRNATSTSWTTVNTAVDDLLSVIITDNDGGISYTFRTTVTDSFNNTLTSEFSVGTARVLMEKFKDEGVSFGKRFETGKGTVQVGGHILHVDENGMESNLTNPNVVNSVLQNGWSSHKPFSSYRDVGYFRIGKMVFFTGLVSKSSPMNGDVIFVLPAGFRPASIQITSNINNQLSNARIDVSVNGNVTWRGGTASVDWCALDGISFLVGG